MGATGQTMAVARIASAFLFLNSLPSFNRVRVRILLRPTEFSHFLQIFVLKVYPLDLGSSSACSLVSRAILFLSISSFFYACEALIWLLSAGHRAALLCPVARVEVPYGRVPYYQ